MAKVSQTDVEEIRRIGMEAALKKYQSGEGSDSFNEAVKRFYPNMQRNSNVAPAFKKAAESNRQPYSRGETSENSSRNTPRPSRTAVGPGTSRLPMQDNRTEGSTRSRQQASGGRSRVGAPTREALGRRMRNSESGQKPKRKPDNFGDWVGGMWGRLNERKNNDSARGPVGARRGGARNLSEAVSNVNARRPRNVVEAFNGTDNRPKPKRRVVKKAARSNRNFTR